ncbi:putative replication factor-A protein [Medicago truncatula]|uniref:Putative replication factor-A protein n=1 Tax=Medicago truncatula TaxID=3880 RepID=G7KIU0_MEDTR|nr:replication factor-A protein 1, amino-terminal domain protein [Medicago truncatula]RHN60100.1 putative replication factor-A protein [Medicago truncatula]
MEIQLQVLNIAILRLVKGMNDSVYFLLSDGESVRYAFLCPTLSIEYVKLGIKLGSLIRLKRYCFRTENGNEMIYLMEVVVVGHFKDVIKIANAPLPSVKDVPLPTYPTNPTIRI